VVRYDGEGRPPVTDGPFAETKDLIAGWMVIDVDSLRARPSSWPGAVGGARARREADPRWLELRPFLTEPPTITE
jgi:hypothetical protein